MDLSWILLALLLVALIRGVIKATGASMVKNVLRLCSVILAFLITLGLHIWGIFQSIANTAIQSVINTLAEYIDIDGIIGGAFGAEKIIFALLSTIMSMILFIIAFFLIRNVFGVINRYASKISSKLFGKKDEPSETEESKPETEESKPEAEESQPQIESSAESVPLLNSAEQAETATITEAVAEVKNEAETTAITETVAEEKDAGEPAAVEPEAGETKKSKKKKAEKKPTGFLADCAWKRAVSIITSVISSLLVLSICLMPVFYIMNAALTVTDTLDDTDATDSRIYKILDIVDDYVVDPYRRSFFYGFCDAIAVDDLMNYVAKMGGKITLDDGRVLYADDVLDELLTHGISVAMQLTSEKSECNDVAEDVKAIVSNPAVAAVLSDLVASLAADVEVGEAGDTDPMGDFIDNLVEAYKGADKATIEKDLVVLGEAIGVLAEKKLLAAVISNQAGIEVILGDKQILSDTVTALSGLSAFGPAVGGVFELGALVLGETLMIPADDTAAYEMLVDDLLDSMIKDNDAVFNSEFDAATYVNYCITGNKPIRFDKTLDSYVKHWKKVQAAFARASEDESYGSFTIEVNGKLYVEDGGYMVAYTDAYKDKASPIAGLINELTRTSVEGRLSRDDLYARLEAYLASSRASGAGAELAREILDPDSFVAKSVTVDKMMASTDFGDWTEYEKKNDSRLCVDIIVDLIAFADSFENMGDADVAFTAYDLVDRFVALGEIMDTMKETSCISDLPELLLEGLLKHKMLTDYMNPAVMLAINDIIENNDNSYADCMGQIADKIKLAIDTVGGARK